MAQTPLRKHASSHARLIPFPARRRRGPIAVALLRLVRPHQWAKNALVLVPALASHRFIEAPVALNALLAAASLSLCASAGYILNDLVDRAADRAHPSKRSRPLASGAVSPTRAALLASALLLAGAGLGWRFLGPGFIAALAAYVAGTLAYTAFFKRLLLVDALVLSLLYSCRLWAGSAATGIPVSHWLWVFSIFLFTSLALLKREIELQGGSRQGTLPGRDYRKLDQIQSIGPSIGFLSVLVVALYALSPEVGRIYAHPERLLAACPLLLYWLSRLWVLAARGGIDDDPVAFSVRDGATWLVALGIAAAMLAAKL